MKEISFEEIDFHSGTTVLLDIRDGVSYEYGHIPGAKHCAPDDLSSMEFNDSQTYVLYCRNGLLSNLKAEELQEKGIAVYSLKGGYNAFLQHEMAAMNESRAEKAEVSIRKKFHKALFSKFAKAIVEYKLVEPNDKIAVCISGGKDSMLMAKLFQELRRHNKFPFDLVFLVMDPGYSKENRELIEYNAKILDVPITVFETDIFENVVNIEKSPCYICARMRRGHLYAKAKELGCNKIALGHHYDDVIETILMGMLYGAQVQTMMPRLKSKNFEGMSLIRPMYLIREADVKAWRDYNELRFIQCACRFTETCSLDGNVSSKRQKVKALIRELKQEDPEIEQNIFRSVENVNLSTVIAYKDEKGERHSILDEE